MRPAFKAIPCSLPYRPPTVLSSPEVRLWWWTVLLIGSTAVTLTVLVGGAWLLLGRSSRRAEPLPPAVPSRAWVAELTPAVAVEHVPEPPPQATTPHPAVGKPGERLREALGALPGVHLYQAYLSLGLLADSAESDVYTPLEAKKLLRTLTASLDTVDRQLTRVSESEQSENESLAQARRLLVLLRDQAGELSAYWDTGDEEHALKFLQLRAQTWIGLKELLRISE